MKTISIDIETYSSVDLIKCGVHRYAEAPDFKILLFGYSVDGCPVRVIDLEHGEKIPPKILAALTNDGVLKWAWNAMFERVCLSRHLLGIGKYIEPKSWRCSMVWAATLGLPLALEWAGEVLNLEQRKMSEGKRLIKKFCVPSKTQQYSLTEDSDWQTFKDYNRVDVEVEMAAKERFADFPVSDEEWELYAIDQRINDRGVLLDMALVDKAVDMDGYCGKHNKTSIAKYYAMQNCVCADNRVRGLFQFCGSRTGRWVGRNVQAQNLPATTLPDLEQARSLVKRGDMEMVELLYDSVPEVLSELIRTAFIPKSGNKLIVSDFSAIEARVLAWLAGETWRNEVFATHGKIYEASASAMFNIPLDRIDKPLRSKGKVAELALGYGGSVAALKSMGALSMGLTEGELPSLVKAWRSANPNIVKFWYAVDRAAIQAVGERIPVETHGLRFECKHEWLFIILPSGRRLAYYKPQIGENRFGKPCVSYMGIGTNKRWNRIESYGGKWVENICQSVARDLLAYSLKTLQNYDVVMHIHDEAVLEVPQNVKVETVCGLMSRLPEWAAGLIMKADGFESNFYRKD